MDKKMRTGEDTYGSYGNCTISGAWHGCLYVLHCGKETIKITQDIFRLAYHSAGTSDF